MFIAKKEKLFTPFILKQTVLKVECLAFFIKTTSCVLKSSFVRVKVYLVITT